MDSSRLSLNCQHCCSRSCSIVGPLLVVHIYQARRGSESAPLSLVPPIRYALYGAVLYLVLLFGGFKGAQFIYFQSRLEPSLKNAESGL